LPKDITSLARLLSTERQRIRDQINAAMIFARSNLINVFDRVLRAAMSLSAVAVIGSALVVVIGSMVVVVTSKLQKSAILWAAWKQAVLEEEAQLCQVLQQLPKTKSSQIHRSLACADGRFVPKRSLIRSRDGAAQVARYMLIVPMSYREASPATNIAHYSTLALEPKAYWPAYSDQLRGESHRDDYRLVDDPAGKSCPSESLSKPSKRASKLPSQRAGILKAFVALKANEQHDREARGKALAKLIAFQD
jgi:hypothetical protein